MNYSSLINCLIKELDIDVDSIIQDDHARICRLPEVGPMAYLHVIFNGSNSTFLCDHIESGGIQIPADYCRFLSEINGAILFRGNLSLFGIVKDFTRNPETRRPFDILENNLYSTPVGSRPGDFFIGSISFDGSLLFLNRDGPEVYRRPRDSRNIIDAWENVCSLLEMCISKLTPLFDRRGHRNGIGFPKLSVKGNGGN